MTANGQFGWATGFGLRQVSPGFYIDETGAPFFYLTALYSSVAQRLLKKPFLNTPEFILDVLCELRGALENTFCTELMD